MGLTKKKSLLAILLSGMVAWFAWEFYDRLQERTTSGGRTRDAMAVPVEVADVQHGPIAMRRTFSGTLEALARFVVAPKVSGRVERLYVGIAASPSPF